MKALTQFLPVGSVFLFAVYCVWTEWNPPEPFAFLMESGSLPRIERGSVEPLLPPASTRDAFAVVKPPRVHPASNRHSVFGETVLDESAIVMDMTDALSQLTLNATFVQGKRRRAMIDGEVLSTGQAISSPISTVPPGRLDAIEKDEVIMTFQGQKYRLTYHGLTRLRREPTGSHWQNAATSRLFLPHIRPFSTLRNSGQRDSQEPNKHKVWWAILRSFPGVDRLNLP